MDKGIGDLSQVFVPIFSSNDGFLIRYCQKLINNAASQITILDVVGEVKNRTEIKESIKAIEQMAPNHINLITEKLIDKEFMKQQNIMLISLIGWKKLLEIKSPWLSAIPTTLILVENYYPRLGHDKS